MNKINRRVGLCDRHVRRALRTCLRSRHQVLRSIGNNRSRSATGRAVGDAGVQCCATCAAGYVDTGCGPGNEYGAPATSATRAMTIGDAESLQRPCISPPAPVRLDGKSSLSAGGRYNNDATSRAATAARVVESGVVRRSSVGRNGGGTSQIPRSNDDHPAARRAAAGLNRRGVVPRARTATSTQDHTTQSGREGSTSQATAAQIGAPRISAGSTDTAVSATHAAIIRIGIRQISAAIQQASHPPTPAEDRTPARSSHSPCCPPAR